MNKDFYPWLIFILALMAVSELLAVTVHTIVGAELYFLDTFDGWFFSNSIVGIIGSMFLLIYYHHRKFGFVFFGGLVNLVCFLLNAALFYWTLRWHGPAGLHTPVAFLYLLATVVYSTGLVLLRAPDVRWLRVAGGYALVFGLASLTFLVWSVLFPSIRKSAAAIRFSDWLTWAACLIPVPYIMHFIREGRRSASSGVGVARRTATLWLPVAGVVCVLSLVTCVLSLTFEGYKYSYWAKLHHQLTIDLAHLCEPGVFVSARGDKLDYWVMKPLDYDPAKKYPVVVCLPLGSTTSTDSLGQIDGAVGAQLFATEGDRKKYPAFLFIPGLRRGAGWGGVPYYPFVDSSVFDAITALDQRYCIDDKRRYVIGLSLGGFGVWNFVCTHPELFAAAVPVAGGGDPRLAPKAVHVAVWAFHGEDDRNVPVSASRNMINAMRNAGGNPSYTEYPGEGHNIWDKVKATPGLLAWLFEQRRE